MSLPGRMTPSSRRPGRRRQGEGRRARAVRTGHVVLAGLDRLGLRTLEELRRLGARVVVVALAPDADFVARAQALGAALVVGDPRDEMALRAADIATARALVLTEDDDIGNLHAALAAQDLNPALRIVLRLFNRDLGQDLAALFRDCTVLSASALAAPTFVAAALHENWEGRIEVAGRALTLYEVSAGAPPPPDMLLPVAWRRADASVALFPPTDTPYAGERLCLVAVAPQSPVERRARRRMRGLPRLLQLGTDRRARFLLALLLFLATVSTALLAYFVHLGPLDAAVLIATFLTSTELGNLDLRPAPAGVKLLGIGVLLVGAASLVAFYAVVADAIVGARLSRLLGGLPRQLRDHVVVCGMGTVGYRIAEQLVELGAPLVGVELHEDSRFLAAARRRGVPVLVADVSLPETLRALNLPAARALIAATGDDITNLETALNARRLVPDLRIVLRLFEPDFAARVERTLGLHSARSVTALAAPAFAHAALGRRVLATFVVEGHALLIAEVPIAAGSTADGGTVSGLESRAEGRILVVSTGGRHRWQPEVNAVLAVGQTLTVVATRRGFVQFLALGEASAR